MAPGIGYTGPAPQMGPIDNFSLVTGSVVIFHLLWKGASL